MATLGEHQEDSSVSENELEIIVCPDESISSQDTSSSNDSNEVLIILSFFTKSFQVLLDDSEEMKSDNSNESISKDDSNEALEDSEEVISENSNESISKDDSKEAIENSEESDNPIESLTKADSLKHQVKKFVIHGGLDDNNFLVSFEESERRIINAEICLSVLLSIISTILLVQAAPIFFTKLIVLHPIKNSFQSEGSKMTFNLALTFSSGEVFGLRFSKDLKPLFSNYTKLPNTPNGSGYFAFSHSPENLLFVPKSLSAKMLIFDTISKNLTHAPKTIYHNHLNKHLMFYQHALDFGNRLLFYGRSTSTIIVSFQWNPKNRDKNSVIWSKRKQKWYQGPWLDFNDTELIHSYDEFCVARINSSALMFFLGSNDTHIFDERVTLYDFEKWIPFPSLRPDTIEHFNRCSATLFFDKNGRRNIALNLATYNSNSWLCATNSFWTLDIDLGVNGKWKKLHEKVVSSPDATGPLLMHRGMLLFIRRDVENNTLACKIIDQNTGLSMQTFELQKETALGYEEVQSVTEFLS